MKNKKIILPIILFIVGFTALYLFLCYNPSLRIRLDAAPGVYFVESIKHNWLNKSMLSFAFGIVLAFIPKIVSAVRNKAAE